MKLRWDEMLPHEFLQAQARLPVCYMPYGLTEPHGGFNALGLDWHKASGVIQQTAASYGGIIAPAFAWHVQDMPEFHDNGRGEGWNCKVGVSRSLCSSIPQDLFYQSVLYHLRAIDAAGFKAAFLITGHGSPDTLKLLVDFYKRKTGTPLRAYGLIDFELIDPGLPHRGDHAGVTETSQLMSLRPDLVDLTKTLAPAALGERFAGGVNFVDGPVPSREIGDAIVASQVKRLGEWAVREVELYEEKPGWRAPTLNDAAALWARFERLTKRYWVGSYAEWTSKKNGQFPGWEALGE